MSNPNQPLREQQALREIGRTRISPFAAATLVALFLITVAAVPLLDLARSDSADALDVALEVLPEAARTAARDGVFAANRVLLGGIERFEEVLEEESALRRRVLPPTQRALTNVFGVGNEQVVLGRAGWLFLGDDFEHVTGRGFLEPRRLRKEHLESSRAANPLPAILALDRDLAARRIELVVVPTPVKPTVHPEFLARGSEEAKPIHNPSFGEFVEKLRAAGVTVFDPAAGFAAARSRGEGPLYLETDTHWTPQAMKLAAAELAAIVDRLADWQQPAGEPLFERSAPIAGIGDLTRLLEHPSDGESFSTETIEIARVLTRRGLPWKPDPAAEVLLVGDSFSNIYSDPALGWGAGAGFAEHLSLALGRGVDRIALNAGGAWSSRQALARAVATGGGADRLSGKKVVIYQFASRELSLGDWKLLPLAAPASRPGQ